LIRKYPLFTGLFFIEGIDNPASFASSTGSGSSGSSGGKNQLDTHSKPWGGDLEGVRSQPIDLGKAKLNARVVYSPHVYGPSVFDREYFKTADFPEVGKGREGGREGGSRRVFAGVTLVFLCFETTCITATFTLTILLLPSLPHFLNV